MFGGSHLTSAGISDFNGPSQTSFVTTARPVNVKVINDLYETFQRSDPNNHSRTTSYVAANLESILDSILGKPVASVEM